MQWLIDLCAERVIETIGIPPTFIDRGDPAAYDFIANDLTKDDAWHDLDLSGIVPSGSTAVLINLQAKSNGAGNYFQLRTNGNSNSRNVSYITTPVAVVANGFDCIVPVDSTRIIEYLLSVATWFTASLTVKGWWL